MSHLVAPSLLAANFMNLEAEIEMLHASNADWLHLDVMDGNFVPNISFGPAIIRQLANSCKVPLDVHLMIEHPENYIDTFRKAGAHCITVHYENCRHLHRVVQQIRESGALAGVALNPHTPVNLISDILEELDLVLVMSVNPGFGGQKFIYQTLSKLRALKEMIIVRNLDCYIEVDGGVGLQNAEAILQAGANVLVAGSSVFKSEDPLLSIDRLKNIGSHTFMI